MAADRRLFLLLIRAVGVYCMVHGLRAAVEALQNDLDNGLLYAEWMNIWCERMSGYSSAVVMLGMGGYLLFGGRLLVNHVVPVREGRCWDCNYDLTGNVSGRCSECGRFVDKWLGGDCARPDLERAEPRIDRLRWLGWVMAGFAITFLAVCLLSVILRRFDVIIYEPGGQCCFAGP